jgi:hypothetical protein
VKCIAVFSGSFPELIMQIIISGAKGVDRILIVTPLIAGYLEKYLERIFSGDCDKRANESD